MTSGKKKLKNAKIKIIRKSKTLSNTGFLGIFLNSFLLVIHLKRGTKLNLSKQDSLFLSNEVPFCAKLT